MLANLELVNCYNTTGMERDERDRIMLASAKENLLRMAYFGLTELQAESHYVFQESFNLTLKVKNLEYNRHGASKIHHEVSSAQVKKIEELNHLDMFSFNRSLICPLHGYNTFDDMINLACRV